MTLEAASKRRATFTGLAVVAFGTLTAPLDTAVNIAFPAITDAFALPLSMIQWVVIVYVLTYASLMIAFGRLSDIIGYRTIFSAGLAVSAIAYIACSLAESYAALLAARLLQGVGSALVLSCGPALTVALFPADRRAQALGTYTMWIAMGGVIGPALGGALVAAFGWQSVFWFRLPIAVLPLLFLSALPSDRPNHDAQSYDVKGAALLVLAMASLLLAVNQLLSQNARLEIVVPLFLVALASGATFLWHGTRTSEPLMRLSLFADWRFAISNVGNIAVNLAGFSVLLLAPYYLLQYLGASALNAGVLLAVSAIGTAGMAWLAGRLASRLDPYWLAWIGGATTLCGLWMISIWNASTPILAMGAALYLHGAGLGFYQVAYMEAVARAMSAQERGVAGSLAMATRTVGIVLGATVLAALFDTHLSQAQMDGHADTFATAFRETFKNATMILGAFLIISLLRPRRRRT